MHNDWGRWTSLHRKHHFGQAKLLFAKESSLPTDFFFSLFYQEQTDWSVSFLFSQPQPFGIFEMVAPLLPCRDNNIKPLKLSWLQGLKNHSSDTKESFFNTCVDFLPLLKFRWGPINPLKIMFETTRFLVCSNQKSCQPSKFVTQVPHRSLAPELRNYVLQTKSINHYLFLTI